LCHNGWYARDNPRGREVAYARALAAAAAVFLVYASTLVSAAGYPSRPVTPVLGFAPGVPSDVVAFD